jgi:ribosomal protein L37AE/L43A
VEWVVIWLLFGFTAAIVGTNKGRSGCGWFAIGVILGPFGLILSLVVPKEEQALEQKSLQSGEHRKCPFCAEVIKREAIVCKHCGRDVPIAPVSTPLVPVEGERLEEMDRDSLANLAGKMGLKVGYLTGKGELIVMIRTHRLKNQSRPDSPGVDWNRMTCPHCGKEVVSHPSKAVLLCPHCEGKLQNPTNG